MYIQYMYTRYKYPCHYTINSKPPKPVHTQVCFTIFARTLHRFYVFISGNDSIYVLTLPLNPHRNECQSLDTNKTSSGQFIDTFN